MFIKKYKNNEYINASGCWVRNFTKETTVPLDINQLIKSNEYELFLRNEIANTNNNIYTLEKNKYVFPKVAIVSNGHGFNEGADIISKLPNDVVVFAVNGSLANWKSKKTINFYIINNPYEEALSYLPKKTKYYPSCILSSRTNHKFAQNYGGMKYKYFPTNQENFGNLKSDIDWYIDDYRNSICAAIAIAYGFNVNKLLLLYTTDLLKEKRPTAIAIDDGLYIYPQQKIANDIIDANLYWLLSKEEKGIEVGYVGKGSEYKNAAYIDEVVIENFFKDDNE